ncbi:hypothetical protein [Arthrobacter sp. 2MCAF14]|uniref:hypothetical protein n=1 Tax=Arthrobacter sp. 2MCAF14 TaxID=3232982 RepID=UPI003F93D91D
MTHHESVVAAAQATFGRDAAMFESLLGFVAQLSVVLWSLVVLTAVFRFVCIRIYRRGSSRTAPAETVASSAAVPAITVPTTTAPIITMTETTVPTTTAVMDLVQPTAVAPSLNVQLRATRGRRAEHRQAAHAQAFASNSTES